MCCMSLTIHNGDREHVHKLGKLDNDHSVEVSLCDIPNTTAPDNYLSKMCKYTVNINIPNSILE